jgi:carbonyl reductase 1
MHGEISMCGRWWSKGTVAVVTGSNKGIGQGIVLQLARHGITVVLTARDRQKGLAAVESIVKAEPELAGLIHFHQLDITHFISVEKLASWLRSTFGGIDILVRIPSKPISDSALF